MTTASTIIYTALGVFGVCILAIVAVFWAVSATQEEYDPYQDVYHKEDEDEK